VAQLRQTKPQIDAAGAQVVLVGMGDPAATESFRHQFDIPFPMICDPDRELYKSFNLNRMGAFDFLSPSMAIKGLSAMSQGHFVGLPTGDIKQLAGAFVIDTHGMIRFSHISKTAQDIVAPQTIIDAIEPLTKKSKSKSGSGSGSGSNDSSY